MNGNGPKRHTGLDPVSSKLLFFWIPDSRFAPSGMTDLMLAPKILRFLVACWASK